MPRNSRIPSGVFTRDDLPSNTTISCDVVIVGSGAGGATAAAEFAEAGLDVVVLEEGRYYGTEDFDANASRSARRMYRGGGSTVCMGKPQVWYQEGSVVGGSTVINGGMSFRTPEAVLETWRDDHELDWMGPEEMELYFERVERRLSVGVQSPESIGRDNQLLKEGADKMGWDVIPNLRNQLHCPGSNNCAFGCPTGAKQSALVSYIPRALHFGARVYSDVKVDKILHSGKRATGVAAHVRLPDYKRGPSVEVKAKLVVIACGSIYTPVLLARSGFKSPSGMLGKNLTLHPNVKVEAMMDEEVRGWEGVHQAYQVREFGGQGIMTFAAVNLAPAVLALSMPHYGEAMDELMANYSHMMVAGMLLEDHTTGSVKTGPGGVPVPFYNLADRDGVAAVKGVSLLCEMLFEVGAQRIVLPFAGVPDLYSMDDARKLKHTPVPKEAMEIVTVHLMGTACMGGDRSRAVTDHFGFVYDTEGLMVADASLFPSPVGVNPMETIQALVTRNAHWVIENRARYMA